MPTGPKVDVDVSGLKKVLAHYEGNARAIPMSIIGETVAAAIDDLIESEGDGQWRSNDGTPFAEVTLKLHPRRKGGKQLQATGLLANMQIESGSDYVEVWSPAPYAKYHQQGTKRVRGWVHSDRGIPQRDFLAIDMGKTLGEAVELILADIVQG